MRAARNLALRHLGLLAISVGHGLTGRGVSMSSKPSLAAARNIRLTLPSSRLWKLITTIRAPRQHTFSASEIPVSRLSISLFTCIRNA